MEGARKCEIVVKECGKVFRKTRDALLRTTWERSELIQANLTPRSSEGTIVSLCTQNELRGPHSRDFRRCDSILKVRT